MYKNWKEICKLGKIDWCLMMALAHANPQTSLGRRLKKAFPKCFSSRHFRGPIPLSLLEEEAIKMNDLYRRGYDAPEEAIASLEVLETFSIPYRRFSTTRQNVLEYGHPLIPEDLVGKCDFKSIVTFQGKQYMVIEHILDEVCLVPAERICVDGHH